MEKRRSYDRLISTMGFPIMVRWNLYIESGPRIYWIGTVLTAHLEGFRLSFFGINAFKYLFMEQKTYSRFSQSTYKWSIFFVLYNFPQKHYMINVANEILFITSLWTYKTNPVRAIGVKSDYCGPNRCKAGLAVYELPNPACQGDAERKIWLGDEIELVLYGNISLS